MDETSLDIQLSLRHEVSRAKWRRELFHEQPPPFLGPLVSIQEAMQTLGRSRSFVVNRMEEGSLNYWKDPSSKRIWILKDDLDILTGVCARRQSDTEPTKHGQSKTRTKRANPQPETDNPQSEDLDAIGGWVAPEPRGAAGYLEQKEKESEARYARKQRENEEWYAAELARLEDRDPIEAVRQLQIDRGWLVLEPTNRVDSVAPLLPLPPREGAGGVGPRPVSWSSPHAKPRTPPEPYIDPDNQSAIPNPQSAIAVAFPIGWITAGQVSSILDVNHSGICRLVSEGKLHRRKRETGRAIWLYDSIEVEALAEFRLAADKGPTVGKSLTWWGGRADPMALSDFDSWITLAEAAQILGITPGAVGALCDRGILPARQKEPGKRGSRVYVPHHHVLHLKERSAYQKRRAAKSKVEDPKSEITVDPWDTGWPFEVAGKNLDEDHGEFYSQAQAAKVLGVTVQAVHHLRVRGRLKGHRSERDRKGRSGRFKWWFYRKDDVHALQSDPAYNDHHKRWIKTRTRKAGWDVESPS